MGLVNPAATQPVPVTTSAGTPQTEKAKGDAGGGWFGGMLGGLSLRGPQGGTGAKGLPPPGSYTSGEVHGDYVKVGVRMLLVL